MLLGFVSERRSLQVYPSCCTVLLCWRTANWDESLLEESDSAVVFESDLL